MAAKSFDVNAPKVVAARDAYWRNNENITLTAQEVGLPRTTVQNWKAMGAFGDVEVKIAPTIEYPVHPDDDLPVGELIKISQRRFQKRREAAKSRVGQMIRIDTAQPVVVAFVGDPHLDDDGVDWDQLLADVELMKSPGVYAVNVGDTTNNWVGKLMRLYAAQETSRKTARKYAKWFLTESGVRWLVWIMGNHDEWESGADILRLMNTPGIVMEDWSARFTVGFANGFEVPIWCAHDFPGNSQWNRLHGPMKAALMRGGAAVYACGHKHVAAMHWEPLEDQGSEFWALRSRGYKTMDSHANRLGYGVTDVGHTTAVVIDPRQKDAREAIQGFKSLRAAVAYREAIS